MSGYTPRDPQKDRDLEQALWTVARRLREFSYARLSAEAHLNQSTVAAYVRRWIDTGTVEMVGTGPGGRHRFKVIQEQTKTLPRLQRGLQSVSPEQAMWIAARRAGSFTALDIAAVATTEEASVSIEMARAYIQMLLTAG